MNSDCMYECVWICTRVDIEEKFQRGERIHDIDLFSSNEEGENSFKKLIETFELELYIYNFRPTCM